MEKREFRIYAEVTDDNSANFKKFIKEVENRINEDCEIIERAKKCNRDFAENVRKILGNSENDLYAGAMIESLFRKSNRYSCIKHLEFNGKEYEAEIDELERKFRLVEL